jgi:hypothetical protein
MGLHLFSMYMGIIASLVAVFLALLAAGAFNLKEMN